MMTALLLMAVLAQSPTCINANGQRACGYDCKIAQGTPKCAQSAAGICSENLGALVCHDPPAWVQRVYGKDLPVPECMWKGGRSACGYHCAMQGNAIACSETPRGVCKAEYNNVVCADPPREAFGVYGKEPPAPTCEAREGRIVCGYACKATFGRLMCARGPFGACEERDGAIACYDPPPQAACAKGRSTAKPACILASGQLTCGYDCKQSGGRAACAKTPDGSCDATGPNGAVCLDPPMTGGSSDCLAVIGS